MKRLILMLAMFPSIIAAAQVETGMQFGPRMDLEQKYPSPTITVIGPFDLMLGRPPKIHIHIQYRAMQYVCSADSDAEVKANGLQLGAKVDIREQGKYLMVRGPGRTKWLKLRLLDKSVLFSL